MNIPAYFQNPDWWVQTAVGGVIGGLTLALVLRTTTVGRKVVGVGARNLGRRLWDWNAKQASGERAEVLALKAFPMKRKWVRAEAGEQSMWAILHSVVAATMFTTSYASADSIRHLLFFVGLYSTWVSSTNFLHAVDSRRYLRLAYEELADEELAEWESKNQEVSPEPTA